jgi:hypothetical protein
LQRLYQISLLPINKTDKTKIETRQRSVIKNSTVDDDPMKLSWGTYFQLTFLTGSTRGGSYFGQQAKTTRGNIFEDTRESPIVM